jgi:hypothetical protein
VRLHLKPHNVDILAGETKMMIKANALGIQCMRGAGHILQHLDIGYLDGRLGGLWGFITRCICLLSLVGTMIVWGCSIFFCQAYIATVGLRGLASLVSNVDYSR